LKRLTSRVSPATVIASIALFVSLGGVSYGVATGSIDSRELKNNDVRTKDLRNNDVRTKDLRNNDVRSGDVRNSTLTGSDVGDDKLTGSDIVESSLGKVPSATSADSANSANSANNASAVNGKSADQITSDAKPLTAAVSTDCATLRRGNGATSVDLDFSARCDVRFNRNVQSCVPNVTSADQTPGELSADLIDDHPGVITLDQDEVGVVYFNSDGSFDTTSPRAPFYLTVHC
jgi:hypothetical protein